jgi:putative membrane protein
MRNVMRILRRDVKRLVTVPAAWVIIIGLCVTPALYAWFNIVGFWDPYGNTQSIKVAVANLDTGATSDLTGSVNIGNQIEETLKSNSKMGWQFVSQTEAMDDVNSGKTYAAIVIPKNFSTNLVSIVSGNFTRPEIQYYVNEKLSAIAPKVTDVGSNTIDNQVNSTFVKTVAKVVTSTVKTKLGDAGTKLESARSDVSSTLQTSQTKVSKAQKALKDLASDIDKSRSKVTSVKSTLTTAQKLLTDASGTLSTSGSLITQISSTGTTFGNSALSALGQGSSLLSQTASGTSSTINTFSGTVLKAQGTVGGALGSAQSIATSNGKILNNIKGTVTEVGLDEVTQQKILDALSDLSNQNDQNAALISQLITVNDDTATTANSLTSTSNSLNAAIQKTTKNGDALRSTLSTSTLPSLTTSLGTLATASGQLSAGLNGQAQLVSSSMGILDQLDGVLKNTSKVLTTAASSLGDLNSDLGTVLADTTALGTSSTWTNLLGTSNINSSKIASFMAAPTSLEQKTLYPVATYGSAMAPLFTNLSLWIGAFVLVVILKLEVDDEGIESMTMPQAYMGRWALMACFSIAQALIVCIGDLIIGVQNVNPVAFVATGVITALAYLSIVFALSKSLAHVGKGICVLLVMLQIPGASGLYPIEMMPDFFRALYPLMPFTYGIDAMRETIGGYYDGHYAEAIGKLMIFVALAFIVGLVARKYLTNLNRLFADELDHTEIFVGEKAEVGQHSYRLSQVIHALVDKNEYKHDMIERARRFSLNYAKMRRGALVVGIVVPLILAVVSSLSYDKKALVLGLWVVWVLLIIGFLMTIEYIKESIARQVSLGNMPENDIRHILEARYDAKRARRVDRARLGDRFRHFRHFHHDAADTAGTAPDADAATEGGAR